MTGTGPIPVLLMVRELGIGGCERDLTKLAIGLDRTRFAPYVGCFQPDGLRTGELRAHNIPIVHFNVPSFASAAALGAARQMGILLRERRMQVVQAFDTPADIFAVPVARFYRTPVVLSSELSYRSLVRGRMPQMLMHVSAWAAHRVVVNSRAVGTDLTEHAGVPARKIVLSHNGVDLEVFTPAGRARKMFPDASVVVGTVCALRPEKRLDLLLAAFARVRLQDPEMRLLIVGSGPMREALGKLASEHGIAEVCHFEPSKPDVAEWMRGMDVFVMCSESESFPNALLEAMACGCCALGSEVGGVPELIESERNGLLFRARSVDELTEQLGRVVRDGELRSRLARAGAETARVEFPVSAAVRRMEDLYLSLLQRPGIGAGK